jgi:hypothetical protein
MWLAFPYYDPTGKFNGGLQRQMPALMAMFDGVCASVAAPTATENAEFVRALLEQSWWLAENAPGTQHGEHSRQALRLAVRHAQPGQAIFFGFLDRVLFALETEWRDAFLGDVERYRGEEFVLFERSPRAWETHPANGREIEQMASRMFEFLHGYAIDLMPCGFVFSLETARALLAESVHASTAVWGEWVLLALKNKIPLTRRQVDWLAWKDAYWDGVEAAQLKRARETSQGETLKRIKMNVPVMEMLVEERFRTLT